MVSKKLVLKPNLGNHRCSIVRYGCKSLGVLLLLLGGWASTGYAHPGVAERLKLLTAQIEKAPANNGELYARRAAVYAEHGEWEPALRDITVAIERIPNNQELKLRKASLLLSAQRFADAERAVEVLPDARRRSPDAARIVAEARAAQKNVRGAVEVIEQLIADQQASSSHYLLLIEYLQTLAKNDRQSGDRIVALGRNIAESDTGDGIIIEEVINSLRSLGRCDDALALIHSVPNAIKDTPRFIVTAGWLQRDCGCKDQAMESFARAEAIIQKLPSIRQITPAMEALRDAITKGKQMKSFPENQEGRTSCGKDAS